MQKYGWSGPVARSLLPLEGSCWLLTMHTQCASFYWVRDQILSKLPHRADLSSRLVPNVDHWLLRTRRWVLALVPANSMDFLTENGQHGLIATCPAAAWICTSLTCTWSLNIGFVALMETLTEKRMTWVHSKSARHWGPTTARSHILDSHRFRTWPWSLWPQQRCQWSNSQSWHVTWRPAAGWSHTFLMTVCTWRWSLQSQSRMGMRMKKWLKWGHCLEIFFWLEVHFPFLMVARLILVLETYVEILIQVSTSQWFLVPISVHRMSTVWWRRPWKKAMHCATSTTLKI